MSEKTVSIALTNRELTLIRVSCLQRLDRLKLSMPASYEETRTLLNGKLWEARKELRNDHT